MLLYGVWCMCGGFSEQMNTADGNGLRYGALVYVVYFRTLVRLDF